MNLLFEPYDPQGHDPTTVARLIFEADPQLTSLVMGPEDKAVSRFKILLETEGSPWSASRTTVVVNEGKVVGVIVGSYGDERKEADSKAMQWGRALGLRWLLGSIRMGMKMVNAVTKHVASDEYYPLALTVHEECRGKGVGSEMMRWILDRHPKVVIDVNINKDDAIRFYRRHGFEIVEENTIMHKGERIGNYSMKNEKDTPRIED